MTRSSLLIAGGCAISLLAMTCEAAAAGPALPLDVPSPLFHNVQQILRGCLWRYSDGTPCDAGGASKDRKCYCSHRRVIQGGGGTPGAVEVKNPPNTIKGGGGTPGTVEVRAPD